VGTDKTRIREDRDRAPEEKKGDIKDKKPKASYRLITKMFQDQMVGVEGHQLDVVRGREKHEQLKGPSSWEYSRLVLGQASGTSGCNQNGQIGWKTQQRKLILQRRLFSKAERRTHVFL